MSLIHWWPLNGNTTDYGVNNIALINNGATVNSAGKIGSCYYFDGNTSYLQATIEAGLFDGTGHPFSFTFWMKFTDELADRKIIFGDYSLANPYFNIEMSHASASYSGRIRFCWSAGCDYWFTVATGIKDTWQHYAITYDGINKISLYKDGTFIESTTATLNAASSGTYYIGRDGRTGSTALKGYLNDIRIYNHALSAKEVKEISKGLMLHYNFEDNCQQLVNAYDEPTFNTSATSGGWGHWGSTGHAGSYAQNTDANYIYPGFSAYSHKVANGSNATKDYLLYQEKLFDGGYRSMQAIIKASDGAAITNSVCFPSWNGRAGGIANNSWTSIEPLGNGFYLCKTEGIKQTTSPGSANAHLVGIYVKAGKTIYVTCCYLENGKQLCSDIFDQNPKCYDCSGYGNNGTVTGAPQIVADTGIGVHSIKFDGNTLIKAAGLTAEAKTAIVWYKGAKPSDSRVIFADEGSKLAMGFYNNGSMIISSQSDAQPYYSISTYNNSGWNCLAVVKGSGNNTSQLYINGVAAARNGTNQYWSHSGGLWIGGRSTGSNITGQIGDLKIYATALSAEDILAEYNRKAAIDKNGNLFTGEIIETAGSATKIDKNSFIDSSLFATTMTLEDGSVWAPICVHYVPDGLFKGSSNTFYYTGRNIWENFGAINDLERPEGNQWEFYVMQQSTVGGQFSKYRFKQNVSPFSATWEQVNPSKVGTNVTRISSSMTNGYAGMYWYNTENVAMCFANGSNGNWYGCGIRAVYQGGIPGYNGETVKGWQLVYMRISKHKARMFKNGVMIPTDIIEN